MNNPENLGQPESTEFESHEEIENPIEKVQNENDKGKDKDEESDDNILDE
jgi:hypothetical protein